MKVPTEITEEPFFILQHRKTSTGFVFEDGRCAHNGGKNAGRLQMLDRTVVDPALSNNARFFQDSQMSRNA